MYWLFGCIPIETLLNVDDRSLRSVELDALYVKHLYSIVRALFSQFSPHGTPMNYLFLCSLFHSTQCVLSVFGVYYQWLFSIISTLIVDWSSKTTHLIGFSMWLKWIIPARKSDSKIKWFDIEPRQLYDNIKKGIEIKKTLQIQVSEYELTNIRNRF